MADQNQRKMKYCCMKEIQFQKGFHYKKSFSFESSVGKLISEKEKKPFLLILLTRSNLISVHKNTTLLLSSESNFTWAKIMINIFLKCYFENEFSKLARDGLNDRRKRREIVEYINTIVEGCAQGKASFKSIRFTILFVILKKNALYRANLRLVHKY